MKIDKDVAFWAEMLAGLSVALIITLRLENINKRTLKVIKVLLVFKTEMKSCTKHERPQRLTALVLGSLTTEGEV